MRTISARDANTANLIIFGILRELDVTYKEFKGTGRHPLVVAARRCVAHLIRKHTSMSFPEIARVMGRPSHSSVINMRDYYIRDMEGGGAMVVVSGHGTYRIERVANAVLKVENELGAAAAA